MMQFHLVTTASAESASDGTLDRFLSSALEHPAVHVVCVARAWPDESKVRIRARHGSRQLTLLEYAEELSLSDARNRALYFMASSMIDEDAVVGFPDDDCWYYPDTLPRIETFLEQHPDVPAICGAYAPEPSLVDRGRFPTSAQTLHRASAVKQVSSVSLFVRREIALKLGGFHLMLGAGTRLGGGEDTDYVLRLLEQGWTLHYQPDVVIGHPYTASTSKSYAASYVVVLATHLFRSPALLPAFCRGVVGSLRRKSRLDGSARLHALRQLKPSVIRAVMNERTHLEIALIPHNHGERT